MIINREDKYAQTALGAQAYLTIDSVPVGSSVAIGSKLVGQLLPNGTYTCLFSLAGLTTKLNALLKATFGTGTVTTSGGTLMLDQATVITAATGVGAMVTATRQAVAISPIQGEQLGAITIVIAGGAGATFTEGEIFGN